MSGQEQERLARVALNALYEPGHLGLRTAVDDLGAVAVLEHLRQPDALLADASAVKERMAGCDPGRDLERAGRIGARFVIPGDEEWPDQLGDLARAGQVNDRGGVPLGLWVRGPLRLDHTSGSVAVVGSRSATAYGETVARDISAIVARDGRPVVSGAAFGIDQAAHRGALGSGGPTVAVLACGVDRVYPAQHLDLVTHLAHHGAVVSELPLGCSPMRFRFLNRNRIIAALARGTVVVEAALRSGALNTAGWSDRLGRIGMAVPGPVTSAASQGVHEWVRSGGATLVTSGADVLELVSAAGGHLAPLPRAEPDARDRLTSRQREVLDAVPHSNPARTESIARTAGLAVAEVHRCLAVLRSTGWVESAPAGWRLALPETG